MNPVFLVWLVITVIALLIWMCAGAAAALHVRLVLTRFLLTALFSYLLLLLVLVIYRTATAS